MWNHLSFTTREFYPFSQPYQRHGYPHLVILVIHLVILILHKIRRNLSIHLWTQVQAMQTCLQTVLPILPWLEGYSHCSDDQERSSASFGPNTRGWYHLSTRLRVHTSFAALQHCLGPHWIHKPRSVAGQSPRAWWCAGSRSMVPLLWELTVLGGWLQKCLMVILSLSSNTCTKPREFCFLWEGEALPRVIKQLERTHSTHKNAKFSLSSAPQNAEATGDLPGVFSAVTQHGLTWRPAENVLAHRQITFLKRVHEIQACYCDPSSFAACSCKASACGCPWIPPPSHRACCSPGQVRPCHPQHVTLPVKGHFCHVPVPAPLTKYHPHYSQWGQNDFHIKVCKQRKPIFYRVNINNPWTICNLIKCLYGIFPLRA